MQREPDLAGELGEREVVGLVERERALRAPHDDQAEQLAGVRDRRGAQHRLVEAGEDRGQPHLRPCGPGHAGVRDHGLLLGAERDRRRARSGTDTARSMPSRTARPHLGDLEVHRRLERLRELEQQLVERERAGEAAAERAQHLVGRVALAVDAARRELGRAARAPAPRAARRLRPRASRGRAASSRCRWARGRGRAR